MKKNNEFNDWNLLKDEEEKFSKEINKDVE